MKEPLITKEELFQMILEGYLESLSKEDLSKKVIPKEFLLTHKDVCELLSITPPTLKKYVKEGLIKSYKLGKRHYFFYEDIEKSLKNNLKENE